MNVEKGLGRLQFAFVASHLALVLAEVAHHGRVDAQAAVGSHEGATDQVLHLLQQNPILVPGGLRAVRILHHAVEERRLPLHNGLVHGRNFDQGAALHGQVIARAVVAHAGRAIGEDDLAVVPALVRLAYGSQIDRGPAEFTWLADQVQSPVE